MGRISNEIPRIRKARDHPTVETSHLPVRRTLDKIGIPKTTFYAWLDRYAAGGLDAWKTASRGRSASGTASLTRSATRLSSGRWTSRSSRRERSPSPSPMPRRRFVSEASVYRILKAEGLVTSPAFIVMKAADRFANPTTAINQLWQTDFTYLKVTGWGWFYLSTVLDDFSRYIVAWKLCTTMSAADVTATLERGAAGLRARSG